MPEDKARTKMIHIYPVDGGGWRIEVERDVLRTYENGDQHPVKGTQRSAVCLLTEIAPAFPELQTMLEACADHIDQRDQAQRADRQKKSADAARLADEARQATIRAAAKVAS